MKLLVTVVTTSIVFMATAGAGVPSLRQRSDIETCKGYSAETRKSTLTVPTGTYSSATGTLVIPVNMASE
ncbi:hypothetical protein V5O48_002378 [Marasmius crinis-equi]|uniref:Uncharacterized protein n=1 Tax=Marasmius crinis-equi TaxID=585013 RepID=A0ABR3FWB1_9AGAR